MSERERLLGALGAGVTESFDPELKRAFDVADNEVPKELRDPEKLKFKEGEIKLSGDGIFYTLQGEGPTMGEPATFLRTHICNLRCVWCDAYYTWNPKSVEFWTESEDVKIDDVVKRVEDSWGAKNPEVQRRLIMTGGEPLIQQDKLIQLMDKLPGWKFEFETNGTIMPDPRLLENPDVQFNCSPKLRNSHNGRPASIRPEVIKALSEAKGGTSFKFVVMEPKELDEIEQDFIDPIGIPVRQVILMPQGVSADEVRSNAQKVAEYAKEKGYRLLGRLQTEIWGAKRRV